MAPLKTPAQGGDDKIDCWRPSVSKAGVPREPIPSMYECGNDSCYKINDPQAEADGAVADAKAIIDQGQGLIGIGFIIVVLFGGIATYVFRGCDAHDPGLNLDSGNFMR